MTTPPTHQGWPQEPDTAAASSLQDTFSADTSSEISYTQPKVGYFPGAAGGEVVPLGADGRPILEVDHPRADQALGLGVLSVTVAPFLFFLPLRNGIIGLRDLRAQPGRYTGRRRLIAGVVLGSWSMLVLCFYVLLAILIILDSL